MIEKMKQGVLGFFITILFLIGCVAIEYFLLFTGSSKGGASGYSLIIGFLLLGAIPHWSISSFFGKVDFLNLRAANFVLGLSFVVFFIPYLEWILYAHRGASFMCGPAATRDDWLLFYKCNEAGEMTSLLLLLAIILAMLSAIMRVVMSRRRAQA